MHLSQAMKALGDPIRLKKRGGLKCAKQDPPPDSASTLFAMQFISNFIFND